MTKHQIGVLACRLLSIYTLVQAIGFFQVASFQIGISNQTNMGLSRGLMIFSAGVPIFLLLGVAIFLWFFADGIAKNIVGEMKDIKANNTIVGRDIEVIGFAIIGLFVIVQAVPHFTEDIFNYKLIEKSRNMGQGMSAGMKIRLIVTTIQFIIGMGLLFGSNGLAGVLNSLRQAESRDIDSK